MRHFLASSLLALPLLAASNDSFLLKNVAIHPVSGPDIANGSILVENGKIAEVGAKVLAPKGVRVVDGKGLHAYPGMIDSATQVGLSEIGSIRETNDTNELGDFNPQLKALVAVNPESEHLPVIRANGITSVVTMPAMAGGGGMRGAGSTMIAGQAALIHLDGWTWEDLEVRRGAAMRPMLSTLKTYHTVTNWRTFATWLTGRDITALSAVTAEVLTDYSAYLTRTRRVARMTAVNHLVALTRLAAYAPVLPEDLRIQAPAWDLEGLDHYLPAASATGQNVTEPIDAATIGPLLVWAHHFFFAMS